jgi:hypothetical protein
VRATTRSAPIRCWADALDAQVHLFLHPNPACQGIASAFCPRHRSIPCHSPQPPQPLSSQLSIKVHEAHLCSSPSLNSLVTRISSVHPTEKLRRGLPVEPHFPRTSHITKSCRYTRPRSGVACSGGWAASPSARKRSCSPQVSIITELRVRTPVPGKVWP